ncbi:MAG: hypothetical protein JSW60_00905 [Thermoplasmatales archaeon]|nr:MAG: hypothetical protein JSW60_00905 [Thermoplasmatales archaeon]
MEHKIIALVIISLLIITSFAALPCISATITSHKLNETVALDKDALHTVMDVLTGEPPWPPLMWTEDFSTFYLKIPGDPGGGYVCYQIDWGDGNVEWTDWYGFNETVTLSYVWSEEGVYQIKVAAKNQYGKKNKCTVYNLTLSSDLKFFGVEIGYVDITYTFTIYWKSCECYILIDWGDGGTSDWLGPYAVPVLFSHAWSLPGEYVLRLKIKDIYGNESDWLTLIITILSLENNPPEPPTITGQIQGKAGTAYEYTFVSVDPDGDNVSYYIDWGDKCGGEWIEPHPSGEQANASHAFSLPGDFTIKALAVDIYGAESDWGSLEVTMPVNHQAIYSSFHRLFERFPVLEYLVYSFFWKT